jgi:hypothetical protein
MPFLPPLVYYCQHKRLAGFLAKRNGRRSVTPLGHRARKEHTPDAHTNHSPNPCKGNKARNTRLVQTRARFATKLYPLPGGER